MLNVFFQILGMFSKNVTDLCQVVKSKLTNFKCTRHQENTMILCYAFRENWFKLSDKKTSGFFLSESHSRFSFKNTKANDWFMMPQIQS